MDEDDRRETDRIFPSQGRGNHTDTCNLVSIVDETLCFDNLSVKLPKIAFGLILTTEARMKESPHF